MHAPQPGPGGGEQRHAGWHADPLRRYELRYHNGQRWTADVAVDGRRFVDPMPLDAPGYAVAAANRPSRSLATAALVVAITSAAIAWVPFIFVFGAIGAFVALGLGIPALRTARRHGDLGGRSARIALRLVPVALLLAVGGGILTVVVVDRIEDATEPGPYSLSTSPCTASDGVVTFEGTLRNESTKRRDYIVTVEYRAANRRLLATDSFRLERIAPGEVVPWSHQERVPIAPDACEVSDVRGPAPFGIDG